MQLREFYASPGFVLLGRFDARPTGCVAFRPVDASTGEIRRLYVSEDVRSSGLGRRLVETLISNAFELGTRRLVLNTLPTMTNAISLYQSLGFRKCEPYLPNPTDGVLYFELNT